MALAVLILLGLIGVFSALTEWRSGVIWMVIIAAVQDPLRKLVPGAPASLLLITTAVLFATTIGLFTSRRQVLADFQWLYPGVWRSLGWLLLACLPPALISLTYGPGSWAYTLFGLLSYGAIFVSVLIGFYFPLCERDIRRLLAIYCGLTSLALFGTFIEFFGLNVLPSIIGTEVLGFDWIRYNSDNTLNLLAGFYRSPDVMGWHAAAAAICSLILAFAARGAPRWPWLGVTALSIGALLVSGRRKMVYMIPFFLVAVLILIVQARRGKIDFRSLLLLVIPGVLLFTIPEQLGVSSDFIFYYTGDPADVGVQAQRHGFDSVLGTYQQSGFWGLGFGFASPGAQNLPFPRPRVWQESGLSRIMAELGVPGFTMMLVFIASLIQAGLRNIRFQASRLSPYLFYAVALLAFVLANVASLAISGQILADPFIASFIGLGLGMQLSLARLLLMQPDPSAAPLSAPLHLRRAS